MHGLRAIDDLSIPVQVQYSQPQAAKTMHRCRRRERRKGIFTQRGDLTDQSTKGELKSTLLSLLGFGSIG